MNSPDCRISVSEVVHCNMGDIPNAAFTTGSQEQDRSNMLSSNWNVVYIHYRYKRRWPFPVF